MKEKSEIPRSSVARNWTDKQVVRELTSQSLINRVRHEIRRMEFEIAQRIILLVLGEGK